ncbi:hypothetical protein [Oceanobacillus senegalensis]|uniref:hypothetical protein n=1 Tax=Oceanobacillus senegalensis TaxID=1936063 RepID=UPI000A312141|nr:hypothetical protein [Oceanobacillus senegalensis]
MYNKNFIKQSLSSQNLPFHETDLQHIQNILVTVNKAQESLKAFPYLNNTVPITIIDKRLMLCQK